MYIMYRRLFFKAISFICYCYTLSRGMAIVGWPNCMCIKNRLKKEIRFQLFKYTLCLLVQLQFIIGWLWSKTYIIFQLFIANAIRHLTSLYYIDRQETIKEVTCFWASSDYTTQSMCINNLQFHIDCTFLIHFKHIRNKFS